MIKNKKGFIGAIGDDLPSLIPIFVGLVIFFAVFLNVFNDYNAKNKLFNLNQEAVEISMQLKSDPVIIDYDHFMEKCENIKTTKKWNAFLVDLPLDTEQFELISLEKITRSKNSYEDFVFSEIDPNLNNYNYYMCNDNLDEIDIRSHKIINFLYPLTLQRQDGKTSPKRLYIIIWE